jgi:hypothetical protein
MLSRSQRIKYWIVMPLSRLIFTPPLHLESNTSRRTRTGPRQPCVLMYLCMSWRNGPAWNVSPLGKQGLALACYLLCHNGHSVPGVCRCSLYIFGVNGWISVFCPVGPNPELESSEWKSHGLCSHWRPCMAGSPLWGSNWSSRVYNKGSFCHESSE